MQINTDIDIKAFESVDQIVSNHLVNLQVGSFDPKVLLNIYNNLWALN